MPTWWNDFFLSVGSLWNYSYCEWRSLVRHRVGKAGLQPKTQSELAVGSRGGRRGVSRRWGWEGTHPVWCAVCSFFSGPGKYLSHPPEPVSTASAQSSEGTALWCFLKLYHCESEFFRDGSPRHSTRSSPAPTATSGPCVSPNSSPARCVPRLIPS